MGTSVNKIKEIVVAELGGSIDPASADGAIVNIELTTEQFKTAVLLGKQWFSAKKGFIIYRRINIDPTIMAYQMKSDVDQVLDVIFQVPSDVAAFFSLGFFDIIPYGPQNIGSIGAGLSNYSGFDQLLMFNKERKRVFSVEPEWYYEQQTRTLHISTRSGSITDYCLAQVKVNEFDTVNLSDKDDYLFTRWVRAKCKEIVGRIRSKYDSMPAAAGSITLDGSTLIAEAKEEFEKLNTEIFWAQGVDMPVIG